MNDLNSFLPPVIATEVAPMFIERVDLGAGHQANMCDTRFVLHDRNDPTGEPRPIRELVYKLDNQATIGYLPTKIWCEDSAFQLLYYVSPDLPPAAKPFGTDPCYMFAVFPQRNEAVEYPSDIRIFIDQVMTPLGMAYVFIFGENQMNQVLASQWDGAPHPFIQEWDILINEPT